MPGTQTSSTKSDSKVAARTRHDQLTEPVDPSASLEQDAERQEKQQAEELKAGETGGVTKDGPTVAHNRSPVAHQSVGVQGGFVDQMTRRDMSDVLEGHFATVDRTHKDVNTDQLPEGEDGYGVYLSPAVTDKHGYPVTALFRLHPNGPNIVVPYEALRPSQPR